MYSHYRLVMKKVEKEFQELLFTKTEGRILEQLTVSSCHSIVVKEG